MNISLCKLNKTCLEDWPRTLLLVLRCGGRGDGILTVRDGGSAPVTFALSRPHSTPLHLAMPPSRPVRDPHQPKLHKHNTDELRRGEAPGEGAEKEGKRHQEVVASLSLVLLHPRYKLAHHYPRCTQVLHWGLKPWQQGSRWKHSQIVWMNIKCSFFFFLLGGFVLYYFVCVETLGSVMCYICCGQWRNWPISSWLKQREI